MLSPTTNLNDLARRAEIDKSLRNPVMFFLTSGAAWLAFSILFAILAALKIQFSDFLASCSWLTYGRIFPVHIATLVYGWGFQAAFGIILWIMARLSRQTCRASGIILTAGHLWNLIIMGGVLGILSGNGRGMPWMEFPNFVWPALLLTYFVIVIEIFIQFRVREKSTPVYVAQWYILAALIWFPWIYVTGNVLTNITGHPLMAAGVNAWFHSGMLLLFFVPIGLGIAYYLITKVTGRPVYSESLGKLGFWSLAVIAPWAGLQKLTGAPLSGYFLPYVGAAATTLFAIPAFTAALNLLQTTLPASDTIRKSPSMRFVLAGVTGLVIMGVASLLLNIPGYSLPLTQFSLAGYGFEMVTMYGFFSFICFGAIYFIVPRLTCREWLSTRLINWHFYFSVYGVIAIAIVALFGGLQQGIGQEDWQHPWENAATRANPYLFAAITAWVILLVSNLSFFLHLGLMWLRLGRKNGRPLLLGHDDKSHFPSPHGAEGEIDDKAGATTHSAH